MSTTAQLKTYPLRRVIDAWWPLAASWLLMGAELPALSAVVARLADPEIHLAAYGGIVFPLALIIEAPVIILPAIWYTKNKSRIYAIIKGKRRRKMETTNHNNPNEKPDVEIKISVADEAWGTASVWYDPINNRITNSMGTINPGYENQWEQQVKRDTKLPYSYATDAILQRCFPRLTDRKLAQIIQGKMLLDDQTQGEVAKDLKINRNTVSSYVNKMRDGGINIPRAKRKKKRK